MMHNITLESQTEEEKDFFSQKHSLTTKVMKGSAWMMGARLISRGVGTIATIILARLLTPTEFGLVAIGVLGVSLMRVFTEVGFQQALIKETDENTSKFLDTAWTVEALRGLSNFFLVFYAAPWIALFFNKPEAVSVIKALAIIPLLHGFTSIKIIYLQKELIFRKQFFYEISGSLAPILVSIPLAILLKNVWAIVIGTIAAEILRLIVSYCLMPYRPKIRLNISYFLQMFGFGKWIFFGSIVSYFAMELDTFYAGKLLKTNMLGIYVLAFGLTNKPVIEMSKSLGKVFFPAFAKISHDPIRIKNAFIKSTSILYSLVMPVCAVIFLASEDFVNLFLGNDWLEMIPVISILSFAALMRCLSVPTGSIFFGLGKPNIIFYNNTIRLAVLFAVLNLMFFIEPTPIGISIAVLVANSAFFLQFLLQTVKYTQINYRDWIALIFPLVAAAMVMLILITPLIYNIEPCLIRFVSIIVFGMCSYSLTLFLFWIFFRLGPFGLLLSSLKNFHLN